MNRLSRLMLVFAIAFTILICSPAFLSSQFGPYPLMKVGDVVDILTPLILLPLYWLLFRLDDDKPFSVRDMLIFMVLAAVWAEGQGMHLGANSIGHLLENAKGTDPELLTHFYDEILGHYLWHIGVIGMSALLIYRQWTHPFAEKSPLRFETASGLIYGFVYFLMTIEGGTVLIALPYAVIVAVFGLTVGRKQFRQQPLLAMFVIASILALICYAIWGTYWHGFPQFSDVGLLK